MLQTYHKISQNKTYQKFHFAVAIAVVVMLILMLPWTMYNKSEIEKYKAKQEQSVEQYEEVSTST